MLKNMIRWMKKLVSSAGAAEEQVSSAGAAEDVLLYLQERVKLSWRMQAQQKMWNMQKCAWRDNGWAGGECGREGGRGIGWERGEGGGGRETRG